MKNIRVYTSKAVLGCSGANVLKILEIHNLDSVRFGFEYWVQSPPRCKIRENINGCIERNTSDARKHLYFM